MSERDADTVRDRPVGALRDLVVELLSEVRSLRDENAGLKTELASAKAENRDLKDEIAALKGLPPRPKFKTSKSRKRKRRRFLRRFFVYIIKVWGFEKVTFSCGSFHLWLLFIN